LNVFEVPKEEEEDGLEEIPIFGAAGKECGQPEALTLDLVDIDGGKVALARGGDVEA
jgi:hypothetical protein